MHDPTSVDHQSSFIENCWLWIDVKYLRKKKLQKVFYVMNLMFHIKTLTIFAKMLHQKIAVVIKQLSPTHFHLLRLGLVVIVVQ